MKATKQTTGNNATLHNIRQAFTAKTAKEAVRLMNDSGEMSVREYVATFMRTGEAFNAIFSGTKKTRDEIFGW